jgi:hypothetical protein
MPKTWFTHFRRFPDGCYAVVEGGLRGPCANGRREALRRYRRSGLIAAEATGR